MSSANSARPVATVFGASGFVARYIVAQLAQAGYQVRAASRHPSRSRHLLPLGAVGQIDRVYAPVQEADKVRAAVDGASLVINCVAILAPTSAEQTFDKTIHLGAKTIAEACASVGVDRLIQISSMGASFEGPSQLAKAKAAGEEAVKAAFPSATILRPSIVFGVEDQFFNRFAAMPFIPLVGGGDTLFQPVYVNDVAKAAAEVWQSDKAQGQTYELGGPQVLSFRECMELMLDVIGERRLMISIPWGVAEIIGAFGSLPGAPITIDQVKSLTVDNVVPEGALTLSDLGIEATDLRAILPSYLDKFIPGGKLGSFRT